MRSFLFACEGENLLKMCESHAKCVRIESFALDQGVLWEGI